MKSKALELMNKLQDAGFTAYLVGGCVRDELLGITPKDYDIATDATPEQVKIVFSPRAAGNEEYTMKMVGALFGVMLVNGIEIATFRSDHSYSDGRRPDSVTYETDPQRDAERRDFTVNALFMTGDGTVKDFVGGIPDIEHKIIRAVGNPRERFAEDKLRMLRAVRFAARLGFKIDPKTMAAISAMACSIEQIAPERIRMELEKILSGINAQRGYEFLWESGLFYELFFDIEPYDACWLVEKLNRLALAGKATHLKVLALIFHGRDTKEVRAFMNKYRYSNADTVAVVSMVNMMVPVFQISEFNIATRKRYIRHPNFFDCVDIWEALTGYTMVVTRYWAAVHANSLRPAPLLNGNDLMNLGIPQGPIIKELLFDLETHQLNETIQTRQQAEDFVKSEYVNSY